MSRNFTGVTGDYLNLGDVTGARFIQAAAWSYLIFFRVEDLSTFRMISSKRDDANTSTTRQLRFNVDNGTAPQDVQVRDVAFALNSGNVVELDTWYLTAITCRGDSSANDVNLYVVSMDGTTVLDVTTDTHVSDAADLTGSILIGKNFVDSGNNAFDGDLAFAAYIDAELSQNDILGYLRNPFKTVARFQSSGVQFFLPIIGASPEVDWSGNKNTGTVSGTTISDMPPVAPFMTVDELLYEVAAVGVKLRTLTLMGAGK